jgi:hypothetical protein
MLGPLFRAGALTTVPRRPRVLVMNINMNGDTGSSG